MDPSLNPNMISAEELQRQLRRVTYAHYQKPLKCVECGKRLQEEKPRAGCRIFRRCCIGDLDTLFIAWKNPKEAAELEEAFSGKLGTTNELNFINRYAEVDNDE